MKRYFFGGIIAFLILSSLIWLLFLREKPVRFQTAKAQREEISSVVEASGKIASEEEVELSFETAGKVSWIGPKIGDKVDKNQTIALLNRRELEIVLSQKEAALRSTQSDLEKVLDDIRLFQQSNPTITETQTQKNLREKAEAQVSQAYEAVQQAKEALKHTNINAPIDGVLISKNANVGQNVQALLPLFKVSDLSKIIFVADIDETDVGKIKLSQKAKIRLDTFPARVLEGEIIRIHPQTSLTQTGASIVKVEARLSPIDFPIQLGLSGDVEILAERKESALTIPTDVLFEEEGKKWVYKVVKGRAQKQEVKVGLAQEDKIEILEGITEGEIIITSSLDKVIDGQKIPTKK